MAIKDKDQVGVGIRNLAVDALGLHTVQSAPVYAPSTDFSAYITSLGTTVTHLIVGRQITLAGNVTVPSTVFVEILKISGGAFVGSGTLLFNGPVSIGNYQAFGGTVVANFGAGSVDVFKPQWWGSNSLNGSDTPVDHSSAVQKASNAAGYLGYRRKVKFSAGYWYMVNIDLSAATGSGPVTWEGGNNGGTILQRWTDTAHMINITNTIPTITTGWYFNGLRIVGTIASGVGIGTDSVTYDGIKADYVTLTDIDYCYFSGHRYGLNIPGSSTLFKIRNCTFGSTNVYGLAIGISGGSALTYHEVVNCWFDENKTNGLYLNTEKNVFTNCTYLDNVGANAFLDAAAANNTFIGNKVYKGGTFPTARGFRVYGNTNSFIGCDCDAHTNNCIRLEAGATGNRFLDCSFPTGQFSDAGTNTYWENIINGNRGYKVEDPKFLADFAAALRMQGSSPIYFGGTGAADNDTNLYRGGADVLQTDDAFTALGNLTIGANKFRAKASNGNIGVSGTAVDDSIAIKAQPSALTTTEQIAALLDITGSSAATFAIAALQLKARTAAAAFTCPDLRALQIQAPTIGAGSSATNVYGIDVASMTAGGTKNRAIRTAAGIVEFGDTLILSVAGSGIQIKEGSNACMGIATLVGGTVVVNTTKVTANSRIFLTRQTISGTPGTSVDVTARVAGTSFTITAQGSILDTSTVAWEIKEPA